MIDVKHGAEFSVIRLFKPINIIGKIRKTHSTISVKSLHSDIDLQLS